ncbi:DENN domain-containing protein 1A [Elysia marginata]|uniref:DENN domain-containing protein 1A n=1 Tax=Elysia marginata TaxID=1093978 RepID=A0AAV4GUK9_9GAST|nr:DENN domain-containing protein 1A [Elysia marginata]
MGSRIREKPSQMFEFFLEVTKIADKDPAISRRFPATYSDEGFVTEIPKLAFPCETDGVQVDHFSFVVPDLTGMFRFGFCRHATGHQSCLCIVSWLPWFDTFYKMLDHISKLMATGDQGDLDEFLHELYDHGVPGPRLPVSIIAGQQMFNFTAPDPSELPRIPGNINLTEYYNALDSTNMMLVFASMLQERRIYMMSKRLNRLTSCIHAAEALLYPLNWQHTFIPVLPGHIIECLGLMTPYIIGVHGNLLSRLDELQEDLEETVFVDLDANTVTSEHDDLARLPGNVVNALKKDLKAEKLKDSMQKNGDALSMAFLKAIVRLIGGYKEALKMRPGEAVTFDEQLFIQSRPSHSFRVYLEGMLSLQLFQEFIQGRLDSLKAGIRINDVFEQQASVYAERHGKKKNKSNFKELKGKIKKQGRRAFSTVISGLMVDNDDRKGDKVKDGSESLANKLQAGVSLSITSDAKQKSSTLPTECREKTVTRPKSAILTRELSQDDSGVCLSYQSPNMSLLDDLDIQEVLRRSPSSEILTRQDPGKLSSASSSSSLDESDSSFTSPRENPKKSDDLAEKKTESDAGAAPKDKLIRPGGADKLIRPTKTNVKRQSADKSSPLSRLLSTRRSKDISASFVSQVSTSPTPLVGNGRAQPHLPVVKEKESQREESVTELKTTENEVTAGVSPVSSTQAQLPLLIDFDSNETALDSFQFDPLLAKSVHTSRNVDTEHSSSGARGQSKGSSESSLGLDIFGCLDFAGYKAEGALESKGEQEVMDSTSKESSPAANTVKPSLYMPNALPLYTNGVPNALYASQQTSPVTPVVNQMSPMHQPGVYPLGTSLNTTVPGIPAVSPTALTPAFKPPVPWPQPQRPPCLYMPQPLSTPLSPGRLGPSPTQPVQNWVTPTASERSGPATVSSVFAARARDSRLPAANSTSAVVKSQADLLSDLIGVDFGNGGQPTPTPSQPRQINSSLRPQPR